MFYLATITIGWFITYLFFSILGKLIDTPHDISQYFFFYILIGYIVMAVKSIPTPLNNYELVTAKNSPFINLKSIEVGLFFKDMYYAAWWPYYLLSKKY